MVKIGSFNVQNLKLKPGQDLKFGDGSSNQSDSFKKQKIEKISKILKDEAFDLIALQEIQNEEAVKKIADTLGYQFCHASNIYEELIKRGFKNKHDSVFKPEYAFLWNPNSLTLERDPEVYKGISDRIAKHFDMFIDALAIMIAGMLFFRDKDPKKEKKENEEKKDESKQKGLQYLGLIGIDLTSKKITREIAKKRIADILHKTLRPPLYGIFRRPFSSEIGMSVPDYPHSPSVVSGGGYGSRELRIINTHIQFGVGKDEFGGAKAIRLKELEFVLGTLYDIVATQRDGKWRCPTTIVAGDYNMSWENLSNLNSSKDFMDCHKNRSFVVTNQKKPSTVKIANPDEVNEGKTPQIEYVNNYDHFSYDSDMFNIGDPIISRFDCTNENFIADNRLISDHVPIKMVFDF